MKEDRNETHDAGRAGRISFSLRRCRRTTNSLAEFDPAKPITLTGPVTKIEWTNPHIFLHLDVKDDTGKIANWAIEMGNPNSLIRLGWTRKAMQVGDVITVEGISPGTAAIW